MSVTLRDQGITKTNCPPTRKGLVAWLFEAQMQECHACQVVTPLQIKCEPLLMTEIPQRPWETLTIDLRGPFPSSDHCHWLLLMLSDNCNRDYIDTRQTSPKRNLRYLWLPQHYYLRQWKAIISSEYRSFLHQHGKWKNEKI